MRKSRIIQSGAVYHVVAKANRSEFIFNSKSIKKMFLNLLMRAKKKHPFRLIHFCIMSSHIHLLIKPLPGTDLSKLMQWVLSVFALKFNKIFGYKGHVWYDRFKSTVVLTLKQFLNTFKYISENPVKAGLCRRPEEYAFSGLRYIHQYKLSGNKLLEKLYLKT